MIGGWDGWPKTVMPEVITEAPHIGRCFGDLLYHGQSDGKFSLPGFSRGMWLGGPALRDADRWQYARENRGATPSGCVVCEHRRIRDRSAMPFNHPGTISGGNCHGAAAFPPIINDAQICFRLYPVRHHEKSCRRANKSSIQQLILAAITSGTLTVAMVADMIGVADLCMARAFCRRCRCNVFVCIPGAARHIFDRGCLRWI